VVQGADERELVGDLGLLGEKLADLDAGHVGADRLPETAVLGRCIGLEVVEIQVTGAAVEPDEDDGGVFFAGWSRGDRAGAKDVGEREAGHAGHAELQEAAAAQAIAVRTGSACIDTEHGGTSVGWWGALDR